jgi:uracil-DNA glycosylase
LDPNPLTETDWWPLLEADLGNHYLAELLRLVAEQGDDILPPPSDVFRALQLTPCVETKVVIIGQDPYPRRGQAHGLCFSIPSGFRPLPASLRSIFRELDSDGSEHGDDGDLAAWNRRGVLLRNTALTVVEGSPGSHSSRWRRFTDSVILAAAGRHDPPVFLLWGAKAQKRKRLIAKTAGPNAKLVESSHPAPPACHRPCDSTPAFLHSHPFEKANRLLRDSRRGEIDWNLRPDA